MSREQKIRPPMVAGMFYPQKKQTLEREVAMLLENSIEKNISGKKEVFVTEYHENNQKNQKN